MLEVDAGAGGIKAKSGELVWGTLLMVLHLATSQSRMDETPVFKTSFVLAKQNYLTRIT